MTPSQIKLVRSSFDQLAPDADLIADLLCARLFQLDPTLRSLLPNDLQRAKAEMIRCLTAVMSNLDQPTRWQETVRLNGKQSAFYGICTRHYELFGTALIWTLEKGIGEKFTFDVLEAWVAFYSVLTRTLQSADFPERELVAV